MGVKDQLTMAKFVAMTVAIGKELLPEIVPMVASGRTDPGEAEAVVERHFEHGFRWVSKTTMMLFAGAFLSLGEDAKKASKVDEEAA